MLRFTLGIVFGLGLAVAGGWLYLHKGKDCLHRCGSGTQCFDGHCLASGPATTVTSKPKPPHRRRHRSTAQAELHLAPGDERSASAGDALGRPQHVDLTQAGDDGRELDQSDLDAVFHPAEPAITRCITDAVGDYPLEHGKIEVAFRVERSGAVRKVRVTAPQLLMRRGFYACVRPVVTRLHFPASGGANVVTYPFALQ